MGDQENTSGQPVRDAVDDWEKQMMATSHQSQPMFSSGLAGTQLPNK